MSDLIICGLFYAAAMIYFVIWCKKTIEDIYLKVMKRMEDIELDVKEIEHHINKDK